MQKKKKVIKKVKEAKPKKEKKVSQKLESFSTKIPILNSDGKEVGIFELNEKLFNGFVNKKLLYQVIKMYLSNLRQGNASTKNRSEVRGGGKKPWRQKGTGRARVGSIRSPLWKGGGIIFGPRPREYGYQVPQKMKRLALISSLNAKLRNNEMILVDEIRLEKPKTKLFFNLMKSLKVYGKKPLFVMDADNNNVMLASRNISNLGLKKYNDINAYDVLKYNAVVFSKKAIAGLEEELKEVF